MSNSIDSVGGKHRTGEPRQRLEVYARCGREAMEISKHAALRRHRHTISNGLDDRVRETELRKRVLKR